MNNFETTAKAALACNGKALVDFNSGNNANIDGLNEDDALPQYRGKANGLIRLIDNFVSVAGKDLATAATAVAILGTTNIRPVRPAYHKASLL